jgi:hypothetical protein
VAKPTLPPNMMRQIYKMADPHTRAKMHVLNKSTMKNGSGLNKQTRSYLRGTGKHQKLFKNLYNDMMKVAKVIEVSDSRVSYLNNSQTAVHFKKIAMYVKCIIGAYKKNRAALGQTPIDVKAFVSGALQTCKKNWGTQSLQSPRYMQKALSSNIWNGTTNRLVANFPTSMTLERFMDSFLLRFSDIIAPMKSGFAKMKAGFEANLGPAGAAKEMQEYGKMLRNLSKNNRKLRYDIQARNKQATLSQGLRTGRKERAVTARQLRRAGA